jgi:CRISPR-associated Csx2 family protein
MPKKFISFLGTNDYLDCIYYINDADKNNPPLKYVQEYAASKFAPEWDENDSILIFTTQKAYNLNWEDNGHYDRKEGNRIPNKGLCQRLKSIDSSAKVKNIMIPEGYSEAEIWEIFEKVYNELETGDEIIFDITHAFRSIPMLAIVILNYSKILKNISLSGIYYGAMETIGFASEVAKIEPDKRLVPVFDLTPFDNLLEWSSAIERFTEAGDAGKINRLASQTLIPLLKQAKGKDKNLTALSSLAKGLDKFSKNIRTNRKAKGSIADSANSIKERLKVLADENIIPAFKPLFRHIEHSVSDYSDDRIQNGFASVKWCMDHGLVQQAYTMLLELIYTKMIVITPKDPSYLENRELASNAFHYVTNKKTDKKSWKEKSLKNEEFTQLMIDFCLKYGKEFTQKGNLIQQNRNDLNHASDTRSAESIIKELNDLYEYFKRIFLEADE